MPHTVHTAERPFFTAGLRPFIPGKKFTGEPNALRGQAAHPEFSTPGQCRALLRTALVTGAAHGG